MFTWKNLHIITFAIIVTVVSLMYGLFPNSTLPDLFDFTITSIDLAHVFRAVMGLYLAMAGLWLMGIIREDFWKIATITNIFFMGGLASGRIKNA